MRAFITTALEVVGLGLVTAGAAMTYRPAGFIVAGAACAVVGYVQGKDDVA